MWFCTRWRLTSELNWLGSLGWRFELSTLLETRHQQTIFFTISELKSCINLMMAWFDNPLTFHSFYCLFCCSILNFPVCLVSWGLDPCIYTKNRNKVSVHHQKQFLAIIYSNWLNDELFCVNVEGGAGRTKSLVHNTCGWLLLVLMLRGKVVALMGVR